MKRLTIGRFILITAAAVVCLAAAVASAGATSVATLHTSAARASAAGPPKPTQELLCGMFMKGMDNPSGSSDIDHVDGSTAGGSTYPYTGQNCDSPGSSDGMFTWTIDHSNVNLGSELGTEHGIATLTVTGNNPDGFNGRITNYDFGHQTEDICGNRDIYYASGHQGAPFDSDTCSVGAPGNFNTHGGAASNQHFNGKYGTVVYQDNSNMSSSCPRGSQTAYCFEAIIIGQTN